MVIKDIFGVIYAPHKTFKRIIENPKYLAVVIIFVLFVALQTTYYYSYYSKVNYEQTLPPAGYLPAFTTSNATHWITAPNAVVTENLQDFINQTFYGNSSLQFTLSNGNTLSATLEQFGYTANCDPDGFTSLSMSIKQSSPSAAPQSGTLTLYTANNTSNYFTLDITYMLNKNLGEWNNLTIPVGTAEWQKTGSPEWSDITGLRLTLTYPTSSNIDVSLQGLFFHGHYLTQTNFLDAGAFFSSAIFFIAMQMIFEWIILAAVAYMILKALKATNVVWQPIFIIMGFTLAARIVIAVIALLASFTLPTVFYPYDFPPYGSLLYPDFIINAASPTSQIAYASIVTATNTYTTINNAINILLYVWQVALVTFAIKAVSGISPTKNIPTSDTETLTVLKNEAPVVEFSYLKSLLIAIGTVILTVLLLGFLSIIGII